MNKCLAIVAVCLMASPALAGDVSEGTLSSLGLGGMEVISDAEGMQVRGMSSSAAAAGGGLVFGQLVYINQFGQNFQVGSNTNVAQSTATNAGLNIVSTANQNNNSAMNINLFVAPTAITFGFTGNANGTANGNSFASGF